MDWRKLAELGVVPSGLDPRAFARQAPSFDLPKMAFGLDSSPHVAGATDVRGSVSVPIGRGAEFGISGTYGHDQQRGAPRPWSTLFKLQGQF